MPFFLWFCVYRDAGFAILIIFLFFFARPEMCTVVKEYLIIEISLRKAIKYFLIAVTNILPAFFV